MKNLRYYVRNYAENYASNIMIRRFGNWVILHRLYYYHGVYQPIDWRSLHNIKG